MRFRLPGRYGFHIQPATAEADGIDEVFLSVMKTTCPELHPLDLGVERFAARIGDVKAQIGDYVLEQAALQLFRQQPLSPSSCFRPTPNRKLGTVFRKAVQYIQNTLQLLESAWTILKNSWLQLKR